MKFFDSVVSIAVISGLAKSEIAYEEDQGIDSSISKHLFDGTVFI